MENIRQVLIRQGYSDRRGFFALDNGGSGTPNEAEKVWSKLAQDNPINAAAATNETDWYTKYPRLINQEIGNEENIVLDAGCGYGRVAIPLLKTHDKLKLIGVDASAVMLQVFLHRIESENLPEVNQRLILLHSTIDHLPFPEETFDSIYSCAVLLHNPYHDVGEIIKECRRVLKPTGKLILTGSFPNVLNLEGIQNLIYSQWFAPPNANGPVRAYTREKVQKLFTDWADVAILPTGVTVIPRQVAKMNIPLGIMVRRLNEWFEKKNSRLLSRSSLFTKFFDVVAKK